MYAGGGGARAGMRVGPDKLVVCIQQITEKSGTGNFYKNIIYVFGSFRNVKEEKEKEKVGK